MRYALAGILVVVATLGAAGCGFNATGGGRWWRRHRRDHRRWLAGLHRLSRRRHVRERPNAVRLGLRRSAQPSRRLRRVRQRLRRRPSLRRGAMHRELPAGAGRMRSPVRDARVDDAALRRVRQRVQRWRGVRERRVRQRVPRRRIRRHGVQRARHRVAVHDAVDRLEQLRGRRGRARRRHRLPELRVHDDLHRRTTNCDGACTDLANNPNHCGACGTPPARPISWPSTAPARRRAATRSRNAAARAPTCSIVRRTAVRATRSAAPARCASTAGAPRRARPGS